MILDINYWINLNKLTETIINKNVTKEKKGKCMW